MARLLARLQQASLCLGLSATLSISTLFAADQPPEIYPPGGRIRLVNGMFTIMQDEAPVQPEQPEVRQPELPTGGQESRESNGGASLGDLESSLRERQSAGLTGPAPPPQENVGGRSEAIGQAVDDAAQLINQSINAQTVSSRQRSPVSLEPHIRGFTQQQIYIQSDGAYHFPARDIFRIFRTIRSRAVWSWIWIHQRRHAADAALCLRRVALARRHHVPRQRRPALLSRVDLRRRVRLWLSLCPRRTTRKCL